MCHNLNTNPAVYCIMLEDVAAKLLLPSRQLTSYCIRMHVFVFAVKFPISATILDHKLEKNQVAD